MGSNYKAALIPERIRQTMHGWGKAARKRRKHRRGLDESTIRTETSTVCSLDEGDQELFDEGSSNRPRFVQIELQPSKTKNNFSAASSAHTGW
jgi:mlo protein